MVLRFSGLLIVSLFSFGCGVAPAQQQEWVTDRQLAMDLRDSGVRYEMASALVFYEKGALSEDKMQEFATLADQGVSNIETLMKTTAEERERIGKIRYFISSSVVISHSRMRSIYISVERVRRSAAPYLHETSHIIAPCNACSPWLSEGLASYVQSYVSEHMGGYDGAIFTHGGNRSIDRNAARWLRDPRGQAVLPYVGGSGEPANLYEDREGVGAPFLRNVAIIFEIPDGTIGSRGDRRSRRFGRPGGRY